MSNIQEMKNKLTELGFKEKKRNIFSKVYSKEFEGVITKTAMIYQFTPKFVKYIFVDSIGMGHVQQTCRLANLKVDEDGIDLSTWKSSKTKKKPKLYDFDKL